MKFRISVLGAKWFYSQWSKVIFFRDEKEIMKNLSCPSMWLCIIFLIWTIQEKHVFNSHFPDSVLHMPFILSLAAQRLKRLPAMQETQVRSQMATHSSILAWRTPWMEEPGRLQSMGSQRVRHDWATSLSLSYNPATMLLGIYPKKIKTYTHTKICTWIVIEDIYDFPNWAEPGCPSVGNG